MEVIATTTVHIDFNNRTRAIHKVGEATYEKLPTTFLFGLVKKEVDATIQSIEITNIKAPKEINIENWDKLLSLAYKHGANRVKSNIVHNFHLGTNINTVDIELDSSQISDCTASENHFTSVISFELKTIRSEDLSPEISQHQFTLICKKEQSVPSLSFHLEEDLTQGLEYTRNKEVLLGKITLDTRSKYRYATPLDTCQLTVQLEDAIAAEMIYFYEDTSRIRNRGIDYNHSVQIENSRLIIKQLQANNQLEIPIFLDLTQMRSPHEITSKTLLIHAAIHNNGQESVKSGDFDFSIIPDQRTSALYTKIDDYFDLYDLTDSFEIDNYFKWQWESKKGKVNCFKIKIGNVAEHGTDILKIENLQFRFQHAENSPSTISDSNSDILPRNLMQHSVSDQSLHNIFLVNNASTDLLQSNYTLIDSKAFEISFRHDAIGDIPEGVAKIYCNFSFNYYIDHPKESIAPNDDDRKSFTAQIIFNVEKSLGSYWLALDFGTSASVASFATGASFEEHRSKPDLLMLDLQASLRKLMSNYDTEEIHEKGSKFLSSELILREGERVFVESEQYQEDIVQLSPSLMKLSKSLKYRIPYLKSLVGLDTLPNPNKQYDDYMYAEDANSAKVSFQQKPLEVADILRNTYNSFVRDFVYPAIEDPQQLNKMIITVPNTFTPKHLNYIKKILLKKLPNLHKDYVEFLSESDAVACEYISNWNDYNEERIEQANFSRSQEEYVLVYDIGAGTTDISYLRITIDSEGEKHVEILGRLGKSTAGNYLDYMIAKIIDLDNQINFSYMDPQNNTVTAKEYKIKLKQLIKEYIKPRLGQAFEVYINPGSGEISATNDSGMLQSYDCTRIVNHDLMNVYIKNNSKELFENFFNLFANSPHSPDEVTKGAVPIDTVLFTGRTILYDKLRLAIEQELKEWSSNPQPFFIKKETPNDLKSIVVKGALQYAMVYRDQENAPVKINNRNLQARYGILYRDFQTEEWAFKELLNPSTKPSVATPSRIHGLTVYQYDTDIYNALPEGEESIIDLRITNSGHIVQSFSANTASDYNYKQEEYISIMHTFSREDVAGPKEASRVRVRMQITADNEMIINIGNKELDPQAPLRMKLQKNEKFIQSMWPYNVH